MTEAQAREIEPDARVTSLDLAAVDRVRIEGLARLITSRSGKVLGATIVGLDASLVLQEFVLAIEHGLTVGDLAATVHPCPTASAIVQTLAGQAASGSEAGVLRSALKWLSKS